MAELDKETASQMSRRSFLKTAGCAGAMTMAAATSMPKTAFANAPVPKNLVIICLEGGDDAVMTVPPYMDSHYQMHRGVTSLLPPGSGPRAALDLDGYFGLHPRMTQLKQMYDANEAAFFHAVALSDYRIVGGDHFGGLRDVYYGGTAQAPRGFLNRLTEELHGNRASPGAISLTESNWRPDIIAGTALTAGMRPAIPMPADMQLIDRIRMNFGATHEFNQLLTQAVSERQSLRSSLVGHEGLVNDPVIGNCYWYLPQMMEIAALMMRGDANSRPNLIFTRLGGYDLHNSMFDAGSGQHQSISQGIWALRNALKGNPAQGLPDLWKDTLVFVITEFGRCIPLNGPVNAGGGTDHGTGGMLMMATGNPALMGAGVGTIWPGCDNLGPNGSLAYTVDAFDVMRAYMAAHFNGYYTTGAMERVLPRRSGPGGSLELRTVAGASGSNVNFLNNII